MKKLGAVLTMFLLGGWAQAQDAVEYYHLDGLGSVRAVSDQAGALIERHDYLPFGEECVTGPCAGNPGAGGGQARKFTGKERDSETDLDYFGARYHGSRIGRFTSVDPFLDQETAILDPQRWNKYGYSVNNPYRYVDPDGRWPTKVKRVHQASIDRVLSFLSPTERQMLKSAQVEMDEDQSSAGAPRHAMRKPGQEVEEAKAQANEFIRSELEQAKKLEEVGAHLSALAHVGNAMHTLQDATSPAHEGFQVWDEKWNSAWSGDARAHVRSEYYDPGAGSALDKATARLYDYSTGRREMPTDFFDPDK